MSLKNLRLSFSSSEKPMAPLEIFKKLTLRGSIKNIWDPQAEALRAWHKTRTLSDTVIQLNTGGGKTLVGLIIAQSLINELGSRVLYVVANNQLVEQTIKKAAEVGLQPAARFKGEWRNQAAFQAAETFCITNYATVLNGRSVFRDRDIAALVFDDAHVVENVIRDQFTIRIPVATELFDSIVALYRPHFTNSLGETKLEDIARGDERCLLFVPMYLVWKHAQELRALLVSAGVGDDDRNKFPWEHIGDRLCCCSMIISSGQLEISPPVIPLHTLPYFAEDVRRVYLTATLPSEASFARVFGLQDPKVIRPEGKSGDAQRLFIFASGESDATQREWSQEIVKDKKACVLSPSRRKAEQWVPPAQIFDRDDGHEVIENFCASTKPQMLGLVARYDGIDMPGDACRVLILDRLPKGESLFDRFVDEGLRVERIRCGHSATRIVQAIGRIFRSNTDHGAVILCGSDLHDWIRNPTTRAYLPDLLQQQVGLGIELAKKVSGGDVTWAELLDGVLTGDEGWDALYSEYVGQFKVSSSFKSEDWYPAFVLEERRAYAAIWDGRISEAISRFSALEQEANEKDSKLAAWYNHLMGLAHLCGNDQPTAFHHFIAASNERIELGCPSEERDKMFKLQKFGTAGFQAIRLAMEFRTKKTKMVSAINRVLATLVYGPDTNATEEAMQVLGALLGLQSTRPDKKKKTGPDNLWCGEGQIEAWGFELKTGKGSDADYSKNDLVQAHDHLNWLKKEAKGTSVKVSIVGRDLPVSNQANPDPDLEIIELSGFRDIASNVKRLLETIDAGSKGNLEDAFEAWLRHYGLIWPRCVLALPCKLAIERKAD